MRAIVVRGGWEGHKPVEATDRFVPFLREHGYDVEVSDDLDVYADAERMAAADLAVQCWSGCCGRVVSARLGRLALGPTECQTGT